MHIQCNITNLSGPIPPDTWTKKDEFSLWTTTEPLGDYHRCKKNFAIDLPNTTCITFIQMFFFHKCKSKILLKK